MDLLYKIDWLSPVMVFFIVEICTGKYILNAENMQTHAITCWTCPNMSSNSDCNSWAPDIPCPTNHTVCQTIHHVHKQTGKSITVNKSCALPVNCDQKKVGCRNTDKPFEMVCMSCCNTPYCNEDIPVDFTSATRLSHFQDISIASDFSLNVVLLVLCLVSVISTYKMEGKS